MTNCDKSSFLQAFSEAQACRRHLEKATFAHRILFSGSTLKVEGPEEPLLGCLQGHSQRLGGASSLLPLRVEDN